MKRNAAWLGCSCTMRVQVAVVVAAFEAACSTSIIS